MEPEFIVFQVTALSTDLRQFIFREFLSEDVVSARLFTKVMVALDSEESHSLEKEMLLPYIPLIVSHPERVKYFCRKDAIFANIYNREYIINDRHFIHFSQEASLALAWIFYLYH